MPVAVNNGNNNAAALGGKLYVFGGKPAGLTTCGTLVSQVQVYDSQSNSWSSPFNLPYSPMLAEMGALAVGGAVYLVGGDDSCGTSYGKFLKLVPPSVNTAQVQPPINADGSSSFNANRGVVPVVFTLTVNGVASCDLPPATISVTRTGSGGGVVDESVYDMPADNGSNFRISDCQWVYNLNSKALGAGTYQIGLSGDGVTGTATFTLK